MCRQLNTSPTPATEELCKFVAHLALNNITVSTIKVYLSGVHQLHVREGRPPPPTTGMARFMQVLRGIKISQAASNRPARQRSPITPEILRQVKARWQQEPPFQNRIMLWAAFLTCFFGILRSGEICSNQADMFNPASDLSVDSVTIDSVRNPRLARIRLQISKTDPFREGAIITLPRTEDDLCPVAALLSWLVYRGKSSGPFISSAVRSTSNPHQARHRTQESAIRSGTGSRTFLGPQFSKRRCHDSGSPRYSRLTDKDSGALEKLSISMLSTTLRRACG